MVPILIEFGTSDGKRWVTTEDRYHNLTFGNVSAWPFGSDVRSEDNLWSVATHHIVWTRFLED